MYWHSYECDDEKCKRGPTGMVLDVRTDWATEPKGVRCPFCQRKPHYRGYRAATEGGFGGTAEAEVSDATIAKALRAKTPERIQQILADAKVVEGWLSTGTTSAHLFAVGQVFRAIARVKRREGGWEAYLGDDLDAQPIAVRPDALDARSVVETRLQEQGYVVPSPSWLEPPKAHATR